MLSTPLVAQEMWSGFSDLFTKASERCDPVPICGDCVSLGIIGDDVGKNLEGLSTGLPKFDLPAFEAGLPTFDVPLLQEVKNEFTSFSAPVAELKVELPKLPPLQNIQMPTLEDVGVLTTFS